MDIKYFTNLDKTKYRLGIQLEQNDWIPQAGDRVVLEQGSPYINQAPKGVVGVIKNINSSFGVSLPIDIKWENGGFNSYTRRDLLLVLPIQKLSERKTEKLPTMAEFLKTFPQSAKKTEAPQQVIQVVQQVVQAPPVYTTPPKRLPSLEQYVQSKKTQAAIAAGTLKIKEVKPMSTGIVARIKAATNKNVNTQCDFGKQALTLEAARILNDTLVKVITPKLPIMVRGYAKEPIGKAVIANALNICMEAALVNVPANDPRKKVAEAAVVMAYQEFLAGFKAEELLAELFNTPALANILGRLED